MPKVTYIPVSRAESGQKLLQFLERQLQGGVPRSAIMRWIRTGQVRIDGRRCKPFDRLHQGQSVRLPPHSRTDSPAGLADNTANPFCLRRVHEDRDVLVLAKPPNLATQPGTGVTDSVSDRLQAEYADSPWVPALVHRLDKETSGLLLVAKTYTALRHLQKLWRSGAVTKIYLTWVQGDPGWTGWTCLQDRLPKSERGKPRHVEAKAWYTTLRSEGQASLLAVRLVTGRKHQIRIQLARRGHPVLGDRKYGETGSEGQGLLLHAAVLGWEDRSFRLIPPWQGRYVVHEQELEHVACDDSLRD